MSIARTDVGAGSSAPQKEKLKLFELQITAVCCLVFQVLCLMYASDLNLLTIRFWHEVRQASRRKHWPNKQKNMGPSDS